MVLEGRSIASVAREFDMNTSTLNNWVTLHRHAHPDTDQPLAGPDRARLRELERENAELREKLVFLKKAAAFFAAETR